MQPVPDKLDNFPLTLHLGTPGVGKSRICAEIAKRCSLKWQDVSKIAKDNGFVEERDEQLDCPVLDEDKVIAARLEFDPLLFRLLTPGIFIVFQQLLDHLEPEMSAGGNIVEYHGCEFFPERWFNAVFVVRCSNTILYDRLEKRGYNPTKLRQNIECEIFQMVLNEANESYDEDIVYELSGETEEDFVESINEIVEFVTNWNK